MLRSVVDMIAADGRSWSGVAMIWPHGRWTWPAWTDWRARCRPSRDRPARICSHSRLFDFDRLLHIGIGQCADDHRNSVVDRLFGTLLQTSNGLKVRGRSSFSYCLRNEMAASRLYQY